MDFHLGPSRCSCVLEIPAVWGVPCRCPVVLFFGEISEAMRARLTPWPKCVGFFGALTHARGPNESAFPCVWGTDGAAPNRGGAKGRWEPF